VVEFVRKHQKGGPELNVCAVGRHFAKVFSLLSQLHRASVRHVQ
jgi:hypothetical protein